MGKGKEYFLEVQQALIVQKSLRDRLEDLHADLTAIGGFDYSKVRVQTSPQNTQEKKIINYVDMVEEYKKKIGECAYKIMEAESRLCEMSRPEYALVIKLRFMSPKKQSCNEIGQSMGYSERHIKRILDEALDEFEERWL